METNPYSPPKAEVRDEAEAAPGVRPTAILIGMALLWINFAMTIIVSFVNPELAGADSGTRSVGRWVGYAIAAFIYYKIGAGKNWARIVLLVVSVILFPLAFLGMKMGVHLSLLE